MRNKFVKSINCIPLAAVQHHLQHDRGARQAALHGCWTLVSSHLVPQPVLLLNLVVYPGVEGWFLVLVSTGCRGREQGQSEQ